MSVTFHAELGPITGHKVECACQAGPVFGDRQDALAHLRALRAAGESVEGCTDDFCVEYGSIFVTAVEDAPSPTVNVSNINAKAILDVLGAYDPEGDLTGGMDAEAFLGRVLIALAVAPVSAEIPAHAAPQAAFGAATFIECGRAEGYVQDRLAELREVAEFALAHDRQVVWA